jgi:SAM-dependent methyltransferase
MLMRESLPDPSELTEIYAPNYFKLDSTHPVDGYVDYLGDAERHRETARRRLALLARFSRRAKALDVGAAAGFFVAEATRAGWDAEGVDVAEHLVEWGRRELGVPLHVGGISSVEGAGVYSAITMWDYIEHSLDPAGELAKAHELLEPAGLIALSTGDRDSLVARLSRSRWHLLTPRHHNFFFSEQTLARLLARQGFEPVWSGHQGARYSLAHLTYKLGLGAPARLSRYSLPVNLFDIVTVVARKGGST